MLEKFRHYRERIKEGMLRDMWRQTLWIYEYARIYWKQMIFYTVLGLAGTLVSLISSLISRDMVDIITGQQAGLLARTFCLYIGFSVGNVLISQISNYFANTVDRADPRRYGRCDCAEQSVVPHGARRRAAAVPWG